MPIFGRDRPSLECVGADDMLDQKHRRGDRCGPQMLGEWEDLGGQMASAVALSSGGDERVDLVDCWLKKDGDGGYPMCFKRFLDDNIGWNNWEDCFCSFKGDPAVASLGTNRTEYFGIGTDGAMWSMTWIQDNNRNSPAIDLGRVPPIGTTRPPEHPAEFSIPLKLEGVKFSSSPTVLVTNGGRRIDVLGVGAEDDRLWHRSRIDDTWAGE